MIHFFYDADSEMSLSVAEEFGIADRKYFIKMPYSIAGELKYCDLLTPEVSKDFFEKVRAGEMPSTSALNVYYKLQRNYYLCNINTCDI